MILQKDGKTIRTMTKADIAAWENILEVITFPAGQVRSVVFIKDKLVNIITK